MSLYNILFHVIKISLYFIKLTGFITSENFFLQKTFWDCLFVLSLSFMLILSGMRLLSVASANHQSAFQTHKAQIITMMVTILICEPSNFYAVVLKNDKIMKNTMF